MPGVLTCDPCPFAGSFSRPHPKKDSQKYGKDRPRSSSVSIEFMRDSGERVEFWRSWEALGEKSGLHQSSSKKPQKCFHEEIVIYRSSVLNECSNICKRNTLTRIKHYDLTKDIYSEDKNGYKLELQMASDENISEDIDQSPSNTTTTTSSDIEWSFLNDDDISKETEDDSPKIETNKSKVITSNRSNDAQGHPRSSAESGETSKIRVNYIKDASEPDENCDELKKINLLAENEERITSKGAVPKIRKDVALGVNGKSRTAECFSGSEDGRSEFAISKEVLKEFHRNHDIDPGGSVVSDKKLHDSKNMTAEVGLYIAPLKTFNASFDVPDNRTTLRSSNFSVHPAEKFTSEKDRLKTFKNWPNKHIEPKKLAAAGFYYCGKADIVECFACGIKGHNWVENDKPMEDHTRWNKNCPFVRENSTEHDNAQSPRQGRDICGNLGVICPNPEPEDSTTLPETNLEKLGIRKTKGPTHPDQIIYETRLATFENWPKSMKQKPVELASAGFYYLGVGDQTLCFFCGGGLKDWVEEDDPWEQHALWFPKCNYLLLKKTPAFVEAVQNKYKGVSCKKEETEEASCSNAKETPRAVNEENGEKKSEDSSTLCKICFKNELGVVFLPCGHMVACIDCASALKECAVCRKGIQATVRAFLS